MRSWFTFHCIPEIQQIDTQKMIRFGSGFGVILGPLDMAPVLGSLQVVPRFVLEACNCTFEAATALGQHLPKLGSLSTMAYSSNSHHSRIRCLFCVVLPPSCSTCTHFGASPFGNHFRRCQVVIGLIPQ